MKMFGPANGLACAAGSIRSPHDLQAAAVAEGLLGAGRAVSSSRSRRLRSPPRGRSGDDRRRSGEERRRGPWSSVVMGVDQVAVTLLLTPVFGGILVDRPRFWDVVGRRRWRVEQETTPFRALVRKADVGAVGDPSRGSLDPPDVVALLVERRTSIAACGTGAVL